MGVIILVSWPLNLSDPAHAAIVGAIAGGLLSFISTYYFNYRQQRIRQKRLQSALIAEIEALDIENLRGSINNDDLVEMLEKTKEASDMSTVPEDLIDPLTKQFTSQIAQTGSTMWISTRVIDANMSNIGLLKKDQVEKVIELYNMIETVRRDIERLEESLEQDPRSVIKEFDSAENTLENHIDTLETRKNKALKSLSDEKNLLEKVPMLGSDR